MSRQADKILTHVLESDSPKISRKDAIRVLEYLGFKHRYSNTTHHHWFHQPTGTIFQCSKRKQTDTLWGFQLKDFKTAVKTVLDKAKEHRERKDEKQMAVKTAEKIIIPNNVKRMMDFEKEVLSMPKTQIQCINVHNFPEAVAEMVFAYENGELSAKEICKLLNESGYRSANGNPFQTYNSKAILTTNSTYKKWKEEKLKLIQHKTYAAVPDEAPSKSEQPEAPEPPKQASDLDPMAVLNSIQKIMEENARLKAENEALKIWQETIRKAVCG
jgi:predicted RNA binding protein YcfA (HicA-like mRNA interferase family)